MQNRSKTGAGPRRRRRRRRRETWLVDAADMPLLHGRREVRSLKESRELSLPEKEP